MAVRLQHRSGSVRVRTSRQGYPRSFPCPISHGFRPAGRYTKGALTRISPMRPMRRATALLLFSGLGFAAPRRPAPDSPWQIAEAARAQLASIPPAERTAADYRTVMDAYRLIYHSSPRDPHAPESIFNVGSLLEDEGVVLHDPHSMSAALGQFEFLRKQYPTSSLRITALLEEARIAAAGLHDNKLAREKYAAFADTFPRSAHIARKPTPPHRSARRHLAGGAGRSRSQHGVDRPLPAAGRRSSSNPAQSSIAIAHRNTAGLAAASSGVPGSTVAPGERAEASLLASERSATPADTARPRGRSAADGAASHAVVDAAVTGAPAHTHAGMATVSGIRHWSTPTYTRVAIDLGDEVQYQAARVPNPDRIFFDLHEHPPHAGTRRQNLQRRRRRLSPPHPHRAVHRRQHPHRSRCQRRHRVLRLPPSQPLPAHHRHPRWCAPPRPLSTKQPGTNTRSGPTRRRLSPSHDRQPPCPAPSPVRNGPAATHDIAALSQQPGKVDATPAPTSQPIAVVADNTPDAEQEKPATAKPHQARQSRDRDAACHGRRLRPSHRRAHRRRRAFPDARARSQNRPHRHRPRPRRPRLRHPRRWRHHGKGRRPRRRAPPRQAPPRPPRRGDRLHPQRRHVYSP